MMRMMAAAAVGAALASGGFLAAKVLAPEAKAQAPAATDATRPFEVERSAVHVIDSKVLGRRYEIYVKTPPGYGKPENAGKRYPVFYLTDGPYTFQVASGATRVPFNQGLLEEAILVGFSYAVGEDPAASRTRDLTPWPNKPGKPAGGGAAAYLAFMKTEAMPLVEGRYRIDPGRRTLSGQSFGGLFGAWVALTEPELFDAYILTSPSLWYANRELFALEEAYAKTHKDLKARIAFTTGEYEKPGYGSNRTDMVADQQAFAAKLRSRGYPGLEVRDMVSKGTWHETTYPVGLVHGLQWLLMPANGKAG